MADDNHDKLTEADKKFEADLLQVFQPLLDARPEFTWHSTAIEDGELTIWFEEAYNPDHVWQMKLKMGGDLENVPATLRRLS